VALEALRGELATAGLAAVFSGQAAARGWAARRIDAKTAEAEAGKLHAEICQLLVERDSSAKAPGR
jgi:hypothetical protein